MPDARSAPGSTWRLGAAVNGACAGIGLIQALCADVRFASTTAKFTTAFARRGLPAENASSWLLPRLVGTGRANDLMSSGRVVLADEAARIGLVEFVCDPDELLPAVLGYARDLAVNCSPHSMAVIKGQLRADLEGGVEASRLTALEFMAQAGDHPDFREGVRSYVEKRTPAFEGWSAAIDIG